MPDYDIYLHAIGTGIESSESPTTPFSQRGGKGGFNATESQKSFNPQKAIIQGASYAQNPDSLVSAGVGALTKTLPWIAAAAAVLKVGTSAYDACLTFGTIDSGDYRIQTEWENLKRSFAIGLTPVSSSVQMFQSESKIKKDNQRKQLERDLLGDTALNTAIRLGV